MFKWAVNQNKLQRAIAMGGSEEEIKSNYIKFGGKVIEYKADQEIINQSDNEPISENIIVASAKKGRKPKK